MSENKKTKRAEATMILTTQSGWNFGIGFATAFFVVAVLFVPITSCLLIFAWFLIFGN